MSADTPGGPRLTCHPGKEGSSLVCAYRVENLASATIYVMDAMPGIEPATGAPRPNDQSPVVMLGPDDDAIVGKFLAPLPTDRRMAMPVIPLARRVPPGQTLEGRLVLPLPLAEASPYFGDLPLRRYEGVEIKAVVFVIGYWMSDSDGFAALAAAADPELFTVVTRDTARSAAVLMQRFPTRGLQLFKRTDQFPRVVPGASEVRSAAQVFAA